LLGNLLIRFGFFSEQVPELEARVKEFLLSVSALNIMPVTRTIIMTNAII